MINQNISKTLTLDINSQPFTPKNISEKYELDGKLY